LQEKVKCFESFSKDTASSLKMLDKGMSFANFKTEKVKEKMKHWEKISSRKNSEGEEASGRHQNIEG